VMLTIAGFGGAQAQTLTPDEAQSIATDAYIYFYPLTSPAGMQVDILGATDALPLEAIKSARKGRFLGIDVRVPSPEHFVLLKLLAADGDAERELRHLGDIQDLMRVRPQLDLDAVRAHVRDNAPDLAPVLRKLLASTKRAG